MKFSSLGAPSLHWTPHSFFVCSYKQNNKRGWCYPMPLFNLCIIKSLITIVIRVPVLQLLASLNQISSFHGYHLSTFLSVLHAYMTSLDVFIWLIYTCLWSCCVLPWLVCLQMVNHIRQFTWVTYKRFSHKIIFKITNI